MAGGLTQQTLAEIQKKALAGQPLVKPDAQKNALYEQFRKNSTAAMGSSLNQQPKPTQAAAAPSPSSLQGGLSHNFFNNTITAPQPNAPSTLNNGVMSPVTYNNPNYNSNQSRPDFLGMTPDMISQMMAGLQGGGKQYDPSSDPVYNSMMELSSKQADKAGLQSMEAMNDRGILNSTVTADRVGQIKQGATDAVLASIPGLASNFDNKQMANSQAMQNLLNSVMGAGQFQQSFGEDNRRFDAGFQEDARRFDKNFSLDEAKVSGRYVPQEAQGLINTILQAKEASASGGISPEQRAQNNAQASEARRLLAAMGVDISGIDSNVGYSDAMRNSYTIGRDSLPQQEMDIARTEQMGSRQDTVAQGLIDQVLRSKEASAKGGLSAEQRAYNQQTAQNARNQLAALGYDVSKIGSNVGYEQAAQGIGSMAPRTLASVTGEENRTLDREKMAFEKDAFGREMNYKEQTALIDADLKARGLDLEEVRTSIGSFTAQTDADYKEHLKEISVSEQQGKKNTNAAIGEITKAKTPSEALEFIADAASSWSDAGVDMSAVLKELERIFPEAAEAVGGRSFGTGLP